MNRVSNRISVRFIRHVATCQVQVQRRGALAQLGQPSSRRRPESEKRDLLEHLSKLVQAVEDRDSKLKEQVTLDAIA